MTAKKRLLALTLACMALLAGCTGSDGSAADQSAAVSASPSVSTEGEEGADSSIQDEASETDSSNLDETSDSSEQTAEAEADSSETQDDTIISMGEMDVLEDDERDGTVTEEEALEALDEQYSAFTDADTSLPIIP